MMLKAFPNLPLILYVDYIVLYILLILYLSQIGFITSGHDFAHPRISIWNTFTSKFCPSKSDSFYVSAEMCFLHETFKITRFKCTLFWALIEFYPFSPGAFNWFISGVEDSCRQKIHMIKN